jgi:glycosyltransferase involved in cell wall biosynthesis
MSPPRLVYSEYAYNFVAFDNRVFALPQTLGPIDCSSQSVANMPGVFIGQQLEEVLRRVEWQCVANASPLKLVPMLGTPANVGYYGHNHPAYDSIFSGSHGDVVSIEHGPTTAHCDSHTLRRLDAALTRFRSQMETTGVDRDFAEQFIKSRDHLTQLIVSNSPAIHFFQGLPLTLGQRPWTIQVENATTFFIPFVTPGHSWAFDPDASPIYRVVRELLLAPECLAIFTNLRATQDGLPVLFRSADLARKVYHLPFAVSQAPMRMKSGRRFLFTTSWHQHERSFYNRGGVDAVAIFLHLAQSRPDLELTIRAKLPDDLDLELRRQIKGAANIHVIEDKLSTEAIAQLFAESDFYLLPAATLHSMSTIEAMAHGCICVLADAWGSDEYLKDGINGLRIPGRHGRHWEFRPEHGVIAERHADLEGVDHAFVARAVDAIGPMLSDPDLRAKLSGAARAYVAKHHDVKKIRATFRDIMQDIRARAVVAANE